MMIGFCSKKKAESAVAIAPELSTKMNTIAQT